MKCTQSLSFSEICQMEFLQNCPGSQSLLHTNEFPEFWNECTNSAVTSPFRGRTREDIQNANGSLTLQLPRRGSWRPDGVAATTLTTEASESGSDAS